MDWREGKVIVHCVQYTHVSLQREARQENGWDCGPFVAADLVSLLSSDLPSTKTQEDMAEWRSEMAACVEALQVREAVVKSVKKSRTAPSAGDVINIDDD